ncbi:olfactory receptor 6T1-like [Alligator sinensis]|uniref:Olfactory receptor n=1 Tax=Alligator sinensis TaxID=38654 RepID=A0A1U7SCU8_ALLSI|nr:olfactory receptor 6T1-like [Alligator sinensis]
MENLTISVTEFILVGFPGTYKFQVLLFATFFSIYTVTMMGNLLIIMLVFADYQLHTPMYIFIANLSILEVLLTSTVIPKMLANMVIPSCITQAYFYFLTGSTEFFLLAVMSFDRYVAICNPLRYAVIMSTHVCFQLVAASWTWGFLALITPTILVSQLSYCGPNVINHFFCDVAPLLKLSCSDTYIIEVVEFAISALLLLGSLLVTVVSYTVIIATILRIPSAADHQKAFSTCASHIIVVTLFYGSSIFIYVRPNKSQSLDLDRAASILNTVVTPLLNPFIYSLRNKQVKEALRDVLRKKIYYFHESWAT